MRVSEFKSELDALRATNSRNTKKKIIREIQDSPAAISFLSGSEFDDMGIGKKTVLSVAQEVYGDAVDGTPTVSESLEQFDEPGREKPDVNTLSTLRHDIQRIANHSGNAQKKELRKTLAGYAFPSVVSFACLNDLNTGISDTTIANALDLRDSLPFYDSVVDAAEQSNPLTEPEVGKPFSPQLAQSESSLPEWQD